jgi:hypothetical protein
LAKAIKIVLTPRTLGVFVFLDFHRRRNKIKVVMTTNTVRQREEEKLERMLLEGGEVGARDRGLAPRSGKSFGESSRLVAIDNPAPLARL